MNRYEMAPVAAPSVPGATESDLGQRLMRYALGRAHAVEMITHLAPIAAEGSAVEGKIARDVRARLKGCGQWLRFRDYYDAGKVQLVARNSCDVHLLCPLCAIRRGGRQVARYLSRYEALRAQYSGLRVSMLTLTVKNGESVEERLRHLRAGLRILRDRRTRLSRGHSSEFSKIAGSVGSIEITNKGNGWHPHVHMIVLHWEPIDRWRVSSEWHQITGDSFVIDLRPLGDTAKDFAEVFKYAVKFSELSQAQRWHVFRRIKGERLLFSLGLFRGVKVSETDPGDDPLLGEPYWELLYRYLGQRYVLTNWSHHEADDNP